MRDLLIVLASGLVGVLLGVVFMSLASIAGEGSAPFDEQGAERF